MPWLYHFSGNRKNFALHILKASNLEKISKIFKNFSKVFQSPKIVWNGFCAKKKHSKVIFVDFILFEQVGPNNSVSEIVWNKSKSCQKQFLLTIHSFANVQCDVESFSFIFFIYMCNYVCFYQNKSVYLLACVQNCTFYVWMNNWKKGKNENFMYKIMRIHVYNNESVYESVYLFISIHNCA